MGGRNKKQDNKNRKQKGKNKGKNKEKEQGEEQSEEKTQEMESDVAVRRAILRTQIESDLLHRDDSKEKPRHVVPVLESVGVDKLSEKSTVDFLKMLEAVTGLEAGRKAEEAKKKAEEALKTREVELYREGLCAKLTELVKDFTVLAKELRTMRAETEALLQRHDELKAQAKAQGPPYGF